MESSYAPCPCCGQVVIGTAENIEGQIVLRGDLCPFCEEAGCEMNSAETEWEWGCECPNMPKTEEE